MNAFCEKCGSPVNPGAAFCSACGNKINIPAPQPQYAQPQYAQPQYPQPQYAPAPKSKKTLILVLAALLVVAAIAVTLILILGGKSGIAPQELNGTWNGTLTIMTVGTGSEELLGIPSSAMGSDEEVTLDISLDKDGEGTLTVRPFECEASYKGGTFTASQKNEESGLTLSFKGEAKKDGNSLSMEGSWNFMDDAGFVVVSGTWTAKLN